jgi:HEAT repeat protein
MTAPANTVLAERARQAAEVRLPRTPERRAAVWASTVLTTTGTLAAARRALADCPDPSVRYAATVLLRQLAEQAATPTERTTR